MQIKRASNGKKKIVMSRREWKAIGKKANWGWDDEEDVPRSLEEEPLPEDNWSPDEDDIIPDGMRNVRDKKQKKFNESNNPIYALLQHEYGPKTFKALLQRGFTTNISDRFDFKNVRNVVESLSGNMVPVRIRSKKGKEEFVQECFAIIKNGLHMLLDEHGMEIPSEEYLLREIYDGKDPRRAFG